MSLEQQHVVVVGAGAGIGRAVAAAAAEAGARVTLAGRSLERVSAVSQALGRGSDARSVDLTLPHSIAQFFAELGPIDHLVLPGSEVRLGGLRELPVEDAQASMASKFWGPYQAIRAAKIKPGGSIVLFSGAAGRRPFAGSASLTAINAAVEALGRALALELAPLRVNVVSPGLIANTAWSDAMPEPARNGMFEQGALRAPLKRVGQPAEVAAVVLLLLSNPNMTGSVVDVDSGALLV